MERLSKLYYFCGNELEEMFASEKEGMVILSGEGSGLGYSPHVVAEPYGHGPLGVTSMSTVEAVLYTELMVDFGSSPPSLGREARSYDLLGRST